MHLQLLKVVVNRNRKCISATLKNLSFYLYIPSTAINMSRNTLPCFIDYIREFIILISLIKCGLYIYVYLPLLSKGLNGL
jgi:hypothetical protein